MPAGSLIFIVIVAIWAAYLLQHWARRRENAAASRSVDSFSEAMRVLEKRPLIPSAELRPPRPHSYAVTPARIARPTVDVKRAVPAGSPRPSPFVARRSEASAGYVASMESVTAAGSVGAATRSAARPQSSVRHDGANARRSAPEHAQPAPEPVEVDPMASHQSDRSRDHRDARSHAGRPGVRAAASRAQRRLRGVLLLVTLLWLPVSVVLAVVGVLMWASVPFAVLTVGAVLVWLRTEAQADQARAEDLGDRRRVRRRRPAPVLSSDVTQVIQASAVVAEAERVAVAEVAAAARAHARDVAYDVWADEAERARLAEAVALARTATAADAPAAPAPELTTQQGTEQAAVPGTWSPVPVPTPTYAMKAKAEPRLTESGIPADVFDTPEFADEAAELDDRALFARRAVSQ